MTSTVPSSGSAYIPGGRVWRSADVSVLIVVVVALICGVVLRQVNVNATEPATFDGLAFEVPRGAIAQTMDEGYQATAKDGLIVRVQRLPAPPSAAEDTGTLAALRAVQLGQQRTLFQISQTDDVQTAGRDAQRIGYQYVESSPQFFASDLRIVEGNELLIPAGDSYYALSLEAPSDRRAELDALWPKIQSSVSLEG